MAMTPKQLGEFLSKNQEQGLERERPQLAKVVHTTLRGSTEGTVKCTLINGDLIWVEAGGNMNELSADDQIYVERLGVGVRSQWRMVDFFRTDGGSHTPTLRQDVVSKVHELYASDGAPQTVDCDASGNTTINPAGGDQDTIIEGASEDQLFVVDAGTDTVLIGDRDTNYAQFAIDGELTLIGTARVKSIIELPIATGGGTSNVEAWNGAPSINLDADGETFYASFLAPHAWTAAADMTLYLAVGNEIAETDNDDVSITVQVRGYADGELTGDAGQAVACTLNLTGGDEAINIVNLVSGAIDYDHGTYPIAAGDVVVIEAVVNLGGGSECTGPLHVIRWWVEYTRNKIGEAT